MSEATTTCSACGKPIHGGDWPFCPHGSTRPELARRFEPLIIDRDPATGQISYPGSSYDPVPAGHVRESLDTIQSVDRFCADRSREETEKRRLVIGAEREHFDARAKERREGIRNIIKQRGFSGKYFEAICARIDGQREARYESMMRREVHFFSDVFAFSSSNRNPHSDERTGWKNRKG